MKTLLRSVALAFGTLLLWSNAPAVAAAVRDFELLSINAAGTASGGGASLNPVVSSNGQYVAFVSDAANLVANDSNGMRDVFWRDRVAGTTRLVSRTPAGASGNNESDAPVISADGRYVAFHSRASNLVATDSNTNYDVFVWDSADNSVTLVSRTAGGASGAGDSFAPRMSANGRVVAFLSLAENLVPHDANATADAFAFNLDTTVMSLASANTNGHSGNGFTGVPALSADGRHVAFVSRATDLVTNDTSTVEDVFVRDLQLGVTRLVSVNVAGTGGGNRLSFDPVISADGRFIAFASGATNLVTVPDLNNFPDIFVRDLQVGVTKLASVNRFGTAAGSDGGNAIVRPLSFKPVLNAEGTRLLFESAAADLVAGDTNGGRDVFLRDLTNETTLLISSNRFATGAAAGLSAITPYSLSADLRYVVFLSDAADLGPADLNGKTDIFLRDLTTGGTKIMSRVSLGGLAANGHSAQPIISADGSTVVFITEAGNLDDRDSNSASDVFAAASTLPAPSFEVADAGVSVTVLPGVVVGTNFTATVTVTNRSANFVTGLVLSNAGPAFLRFVAATASQGAIGTNLWFVGDLPGNGSAIATITLMATNSGVGGVTATVLRLDQTDLINGNDAASSPVTASFTGTDLELTGTGPTTTFYGSNFVVSLTVSNRGPAAATSVVVTNADPGDVNFVSVTTSQGTADTNGTWTVGTLAAGATATFTATLMPEGSGFLLFRAGVSSAVLDPHTPNDTVNLGVTIPNLAPNLRFASNTLTLPEDLPTLSIPAFLQVHPQESNQFITNLSVVVDNPALFTAGPTLQTNGLLQLTLAANVTGTATVTVSATDNGGTLGGGVPTGSNSFVINVTAVNDAPAFGFSTNHVVVLEDTGGQTLAGFITSLSVGPGNESGQSITNYLVTTSSNALFTVLPAVALNGTLTFTPAVNANGSVTVTVVAQDDGGTAGGGVNTATNTFTLTVTPVNDAPAVTLTTNNVVVAQDSGARLLPGFATPVFGPADEAGQAVVSYTVSPNSAALFQVAPAISLGGDLTFTPAAGANGSTPVMVVVQDSGGTANGGANLATNTFTITITVPVAANFTWLGGTGDWHDPARWSPAGVPGAIDSASISGGTAQLTNGVTVGSLALSGGTLSGGGGLTIVSNLNWSAGTLDGAGALLISTGATATLSSASTKTLRRSVDNAGTFIWTGGTILANNNPTFTNRAGAVFDIQVDNTFFSTSDSSVRTFNNAGTVRKTAGAGTTTWEGVLNNDGTLAVQTGTLNLSGSGLSSGAFTNATGAVLAWTSGTYELTNGVTITGPGTRRVAGATLNVSAGATVSPAGMFELTSGTLGGAGNFTVPSGSQFDWTAGTLQTGGVFTVAAGGTLAMSSASTKTLRRQLDNAGTVTWTGGTIIGNSNPTFNNLAGGVFDAQVDNTFFSTSDSSVRTFNNAGTVRKSAGAGTTTWQGVLNNDGTLAVQTGTLNLSGSGLSSGTFTNAAGAVLAWTSGTYELTNGVTITGPGTRSIAGATLNVAAGASVSPAGVFELISGTLGGVGNFTVPSGSQFDWTAGTMQTGGVFNVAAGGTLAMSGASTKTLRRQLDNAGTVTWTGGTVIANSDPTINNQAGALFDIQVDNTFFSTSDSSVRTFNNAGTLRKSAGTGTTTWQGALNNDGTVAVQTGTLSLTDSGLSSGTFSGAAGTVFAWSTGTHSLTNGATFTGPGLRKIVGATVEVTAGTTISPEGVFEQTGGVLGGLGNFTLPAGSQYEWQSGTIHTGGVFTVAAGGSMTLTAGATKVLRRTFNNSGTVIWQNGTVQGNSNPTFNNLAGGLLDAQVDNTFFATSDSSVPVFNNAGTLRKSAGGGTTTWAGTLNNTGTLDVQTGTFSLTGSGLASGAFAGSSGAVLMWAAGTHVVTNGTTFTGPGTRRITSSSTLEVAAGTTISPAGVFELTSGTLGGAGNFTVPSGTQFNWAAGTIHTGGVFTVAAGGRVTASSGSTKTLRRQFDNSGTFTWTGGQVLGNSNPTFNNQAGAVFDVQADTSFFNTSDSSTPIFNNAGTLRKSAGTGTTTWFGTLNQNGALEIRQGTFTLGSTYTPAGDSSLTVFLGGTTAGTQFGRLIAGNHPFAGTLNIVLTNGFVPALSNSFHIVDGGTGSGVFTNTTGRFVAGGLVLETNYSGGDLTLQALAVNTAPSFTLTNFPATDGVQDWVRDASTNAALGVKVAVDSSGNVFVAGDEYLGQDYNIVVAKYSPTGTLLWTNVFSGSPGGTDQVKGLALDSSGNVLITGYSISSTYDYVTLKYSAAGTPVWTNFYDNGGDDTPQAVTVDSAGNVIVTGQSANGQYADYLTIKYQANGTPVWTNRSSYAGPGTDIARSVAVDASGDVYVTGDGSNTDYDYAYTLKFSGATGTPIWTNQFDINGDNSYGVAVAVDNNGDVLVAANYLETVVKFAVIKYTAAGVPVWTNLYDRATSHDQHIRAMAVDGSGNAIITGETYNGTDFDYTTLKVLGSGVSAWTNHYDGVGGGVADYPLAITVNSSADVFVTGHSTRNNGKDFLTVKYTSAGVGVWTNRYNGASNGDDQANAVAVDASGNVFVTGTVDDPVATSVLRTIKYALVPSAGASQTVSNTIGAVTVSGFVVSSSVGSTNESSQTLSFVVTNDNNGLFSVQPAISAAGVLTYTVNPGVSGVAVVTVRAQDTGGSANGGVDTSAPQSFSITVGTGTSGVAFTWLGGTGPWNNPANWSPNGVPGVADTVTISSGNAQVTNTIAVHTLTLAGGFISGAGSLSIRSAMTWSGGTLIGAGTTTIANGAVLTVSGGADKDLRRRLDNYGTVTWTAGRILGHDAATIYNYAGALFDTKTEATLFESGDGTVKTFNNFGTVRKSAGTGTSEWSGSFNNSGTVNVQTGTLNPSGAVTLNNSSYTGTGQFMLTGATLAGTLTIAAGADVDFASGSLLGTGTIVGTMSWTGGTFGPGGTTTIATNGVLLISGATDKDLRHTLDNYGTVTWSGARILGHQAPVIINRAGALFDAQANTTLFESGDGTIKTFNNSGTVRRTAGTGTTTWNGRFNNDAVLRVESGAVALIGGGTSAGTFTNLAGATLEFSGGTHTLSHGVTFTGAGTNLIDGGTVNVSAGATATATGIMGLATGALGGTGTLLVTSGGQFNWTGGTMDGTTGITLITNSATMIVSSGADKDLRRRLDNYGTVTWTTGRILGHSTPVINNYTGALFDTQSDATLFESGDGTIKTFNNFGTVRKSGGTATSTWNGTFNHNGAADVQTGTLNPNGAVTLGNSSYSGAGRYLITGATLAGTLTIAGGANVEISGSSVGGSGTVVGTLNWTSGTLGTGGTLTIATNGALVVSGAADKDLRQTLDNYGTVTWSGARILGHQAPVIINRAGALFDAQANTTLFESGDGTIKTFNNSGTVRRTAGTGTTTWNGRFNNDAVLRVESGAVALIGGGTSAGTFTNLAGATLEFSGGTHTLNDGALFTGAGTNLIDGGTVNVSTNATATATGTFTLSTGTLGGTGTLLVGSGSQFNWTGGTMAGATGRTVVTNGAAMLVSSGADKDLRRVLDNHGTVTWTAGRILGHATPTINNLAGGLFDVQVDTTLFESGDGSVKTFNNAGTLRKSAGTGTSTVLGVFNLGGTANVQTGTLNPVGTVTATSPSYSGMGRFLFTTGTLTGTQTVAAGANVELASGTLFGTWTLAGTMNWTSGSLGSGGSTTIPAGSTLLVSSAADKDLRRTLNNSGTVLWTAGRILGHSTPVINNLAGAVFETQVAATLFESGDGSAKTFNNSGTVRKTMSTGTSTFLGTFNNSSVLEIQIGVLSLANGYGPAAGSSLKVFLGGLTAGTQFGQLQVSGSTAFAGTLNIVLTNGFTPVVPNSFLVVNSGGGSGAFASLVGDSLGGGLSLVPSYLLGDLTLTTTMAAGLPPLSPQAFGTERLLRWPADAGGHVLETALSITGPWTPVLAPVAQENGDSIVRLPAQGTRFYRLVPVAPPRPGDNPTQ